MYSAYCIFPPKGYHTKQSHAMVHVCSRVELCFNFEVRHSRCVIQISLNEVKRSRNTTKGILAKMESG